MESGDVNSDRLRVRPLPLFVDGDWVKAQFGPATAKVQLLIAGNLAKQYRHWTGDEMNNAFFEKIAQDLAIPGFVADAVNAAWRDDKKPKKPPFSFIFKRIFLRTGGGQETSLSDQTRIMNGVTRAIAGGKPADARDLSFFAAIWLKNPKTIFQLVSPLPECKELTPFLADFARKNNEQKRRPPAGYWAGHNRY